MGVTITVIQSASQFCSLFLRVGFSLLCACQLVADMMLDLEFP